MMELVIGGSGSGKSAYAEASVCRWHSHAEEVLKKEIPLYYIADMIPYGEETQEKIRSHRRMRAGKGFHTLEWYMGLEEQVRKNSRALDGACVLLECISNLTANEIYTEGGAAGNTVKAVANGVQLLKESCDHLVVVTNDVFAESVPDSPEMRMYKENLADINSSLAEMADRVTEVVSGVPVPVKMNGEDVCSVMENGKMGQISDMEKEHWPGKNHGMEKTVFNDPDICAEKPQEGGVRLITGGAFQGKRAFAEILYPGRQWTDGGVCPLVEVETYTAIDHFHLLVRRWLEAGRTAEELTGKILENKKDVLIICDEIGCGLVPVDAFEREYRETVGRICTALAERSSRVDRVVCGIGIRIK